MTFLTEHPLRKKLFNESHARPYVNLSVPLQVSHLVFITGKVTPDKECQHLKKLVELYAVAPPIDHAMHYNADLGDFSIKWEKHTEFSSYTFFAKKQCTAPCQYKAIDEISEDWLKEIEGELLVAQHIELLSKKESNVDQVVISKLFQENSLVGSFVGGTSAEAWTDFRLQKDGFNQILVLDNDLTAQTAGRLIQHLLELETYRMLALLSFPLVAEYSKQIGNMEQQLTNLTQQISDLNSNEGERKLLESLTNLEANIENIIAATSYRFSATKAYKSIVMDRLSRLRENRIKGRQMLSRYLERRFQPAMDACDSMASRLESLSVRIARASQILMARVDLALESQNQDLLNSMDKRAQLQLRLQQTVEGLSIAAITYYIVRLMSYIAKAIKSLGIPISIDLFVGASIPIVLLIVWLAIRTIKGKIMNEPKT